MIKWFKKNQGRSEEQSQDDTLAKPSKPEAPHKPQSDKKMAEASEPSQGIFTRFKQGLSKTRHQLGAGVGRLLLGKKEIDKALLEELEFLLISADVGMETTESIVKHLQEGLARKSLADGEAVIHALKKQLLAILDKHNAPLELPSEPSGPFVILMVGVNGAGKTTISVSRQKSDVGCRGYLQSRRC